MSDQRSPPAGLSEQSARSSLASLSAKQESNIVPLRLRPRHMDMPCTPVRIRHSHTAYDDPPRWLRLTIAILITTLLGLALIALPVAGEADHGQRVPTGIRGSDRAAIPSASRTAIRREAAQRQAEQEPQSPDQQEVGGLR